MTVEEGGVRNDGKMVVIADILKLVIQYDKKAEERKNDRLKSIQQRSNKESSVGDEDSGEEKLPPETSTKKESKKKTLQGENFPFLR
jgi:hypothetical protein